MCPSISDTAKIPWSAQDDATILQLKTSNPKISWVEIASKMATSRSAKLCRNRWFYNLDPDINREAWTSEEDADLRRLFVTLNGSFGKIARQMPGRTDNVCRNRFCCIEPDKARQSNLINKNECTHGNVARRCVECNGSDVCEHRVTRQWCSTCQGSLLIRLQIKNQLAIIKRHPASSIHARVTSSIAKMR